MHTNIFVLLFGKYINKNTSLHPYRKLRKTYTTFMLDRSAFRISTQEKSKGSTKIEERVELNS